MAPAVPIHTATHRAATTTRFRAARIGGLRITDAPPEAQVFADGYYVGIVDDFDGVFQHANLEAGTHRIEIQAPGFESVAFDVLVQPGRTITFRADMRRSSRFESRPALACSAGRVVHSPAILRRASEPVRSPHTPIPPFLRPLARPDDGVVGLSLVYVLYPAVHRPVRYSTSRRFEDGRESSVLRWHD